MKHTWLLITALPAQLCPLLNVPKVTPEKKSDDDCTTSYILNSGLTKQNVTKFLRDIVKWLKKTSASVTGWRIPPHGNPDSRIKVHQIRGEIFIGQTPNHAKFRGKKCLRYPQSIVLSEEVEFTEIFHKMLLTKATRCKLTKPYFVVIG